ncbi:hypothetical protein [Nocardia miyunensis]|uniref:hypothetical protein n=1 Tax=Nocardia miyunensis TaxID=282684 RepID=UPI000A47D3D5|nr:hypothetical protein [Nocardia miyunensis]
MRTDPDPARSQPIVTTTIAFGIGTAEGILDAAIPLGGSLGSHPRDTSIYGTPS